jgi:hypothetical protein
VEFTNAPFSRKLVFDQKLQFAAYDQFYKVMTGSQNIKYGDHYRRWWESYVGGIPLADRNRFFSDVPVSRPPRYRMMMYNEDQGMHFVGDWQY